VRRGDFVISVRTGRHQERALAGSESAQVPGLRIVKLLWPDVR